MSEDNNKPSDRFFGPIPKKPTIASRSITQGHVNYARIRDRVKSGAIKAGYISLMGISFIGALSVFDFIQGQYAESKGERVANQERYQSIIGNNIIKDHISTMSGFQPKLKAETEATVMTADEYRGRVQQIADLLMAGNSRALYEIPGVIVNGLGQSILGTQILIVPSLELIADPENPEETISRKLGYLITAHLKYEEPVFDKETDEQTGTKTVIATKSVALNIDSGNVYELTTTDEDGTRILSGPELFKTFTDAENIRVFGNGLVSGTPLSSTAKVIDDASGDIVKSYTKGLFPPEKTDTSEASVGGAVSYILNTLSETGTMPEKFKHRLVDFETFRKEGFADPNTNDYSVPKMIAIEVDGVKKLLLLATTKVTGKDGKEFAKPMLGMFTNNNGQYTYKNVDFGNDKWVKLEKFESISISNIQRELIELNNIKELKI